MPHQRGLIDERGTALVVALMATLLLSALGLAVIMVSQTETMITANFNNAQEALYSADAGVERAVQDLLMAPRWNDVLAGTSPSGWVDASTTPTLPDGTALNLTTETTRLQNETDSLDLWGLNDPTWRLYAYGAISNLLPTETINSMDYVVVWVGDDPSETDNNPNADTNGVLTLHTEAFGPQGSKKVVEVTVARTSSTEIERGYIAQRGQEELNQRARKSAVQTPGRAATEMRMNTTGAAGLVVQ